MKRLRKFLTGGARAAERGFTLLEIMIVLAIMGLIVTGVSIKVFSQLKKAKVSTAKIGVKKVADAADAKDPWGTAYVFRCPGTQDTDGVDVSSWGPDKADGTADDIRSWDQ